MAPNKTPVTPPHVKAHATGRWAETLFRALSSRVANRWKFVSFRGKNKAEWRGVVDLIAIRKNTSQPKGELLKRGDVFDIILIQLKGASARGPSEDDCLRLLEVKRLYRANAVVLFQWRKAEAADFLVLRPNLEWRRSTGQEIFG